MFFLSCVCHAFVSVCLCVPYGHLLTLVCGGQLLVCHFPIGILGQVWNLIVSILDLFIPTYFNTFAAKHLKKTIPQCHACFKDS